MLMVKEDLKMNRKRFHFLKICFLISAVILFCTMHVKADTYTDTEFFNPDYAYNANITRGSVYMDYSALEVTWTNGNEIDDGLVAY